MTDPIVSIYAAPALEVAYLVCAALEEHGITATISFKQVVGAHELPVIEAPHYVQVHCDDAEVARQIVAQLEEAKGRSKLLLDREAEADDDPWPSCPHCGQPRHTSCPWCETAGSEFPQAYLGPQSDDDFEPSDEDETDIPDRFDPSRPLLVICPTCDEPFRPLFAARCEWCGHRFGDGRELPPSGSIGDAELNARVWMVAALLAIAILLEVALLMHIANSG
jgi:hypothetical protein